MEKVDKRYKVDLETTKKGIFRNDLTRNEFEFIKKNTQFFENIKFKKVRKVKWKN